MRFPPQSQAPLLGTAALVLASLLFGGIFPSPLQAAERTVTLVVTVKEDDGKTPIPTARVNVYQKNIRGSQTFVRVPDYQEETNASGVARFAIKLTKGAPLQLSIETGREDKIGETQDVDYGTEPPAQILRQFFLKSRAVEKTPEAEISNVKVVVKRKDTGAGIDGADVEVIPRSGGGRRFSGRTNASGEVTIVTPMSEDFDVRASKELFGSGAAKLTLKQPQRDIGPIEVLLTRDRGTEVTVRVLDDRNGDPIGDARVIFDGPGYVRESTNASGTTTLLISEPGTYNVRISQEYYDKLQEQVTIAAGSETQTEEFYLTHKKKREEEKDKIEITVLGRDPSDKDSKAKPLSRATVKIGRSSMGTDENGHVTFRGSFENRVEVRAEAKGYKPQTKTVSLGKMMRYSAGEATVRFTLEAHATEEDHFDVIAHVIDPLGDPLPGVTVSWSSVTGEEDLFGGRTNASGEHEFSSMHAPYLEVTTLRKGLKVKVTRPGFIERDYTIGADQLQPSTQPRRVSVQMDKDWSELEKAIAALEARVSAWRNDASRARAKLQSFEQLVSKLVAAPGRVAAIVQELKNAEKAFNAKLSSTTCAQAMELKNTVLSLHGQANQKGQEFDAAMKEANALGEACSTQAQAEKIMASYKTGIRLVGEIGALGKKAQEANEKLGRFAEAMKEGAALQTQLQQTSAAIETEISDAQKDEETASSNYQDAYYASKSLPGTRAALAAEVQKLKNDADLKKYASKAKTLVKRIDALEESLGSVNNDVSFARAPDPKRLEVIDQTRNKLHDYKKEADGILSGFKAALCDAQPQDSAIEEIRTRVTNASFDIGLAADLPAKAKACETRVAAAASPTPAPGDEVVVPDLSVFGGLSEMKAAASHAGLVPAVAATKATPPPGTTRMFAGQEPAANTKVKKGSALKILVYQQMAQASPSPSPSATAIAQTSPSPPADEVRVPDLSVFDGVGEMKAAASHVGLVPALAATKATPPPGATRLFAGQEPAAGSKAKRGSTLKILVYQQAATAAASPSPSGSPSDNAVAASGKMPDLTGLTLEQAMTRLTSNMRIGGDEVGDKPPAPEKAMTIFAQTPAAGSTIDTKKNVVVTVKRYGSSKSAEEATPPPFEEQPTGAVSSAGLEGTWGGSLGVKGEGKPTYAKFDVRRDGDGYVVYMEKGKPLRMSGQGNMLVYQDKVDLDFNLFGGKAAKSEPLNIRVTATLITDNELQIWFKAWSSSGQKEGVLGTLRRLN